MTWAQELLHSNMRGGPAMIQSTQQQIRRDLVSCADACARVSKAPCTGSSISEAMLLCSDTCMLSCAVIERENRFPFALIRRCADMCDMCASLSDKRRRPCACECAMVCRRCAVMLRAATSLANSTAFYWGMDITRAVSG